MELKVKPDDEARRLVARLEEGHRGFRDALASVDASALSAYGVSAGRDRSRFYRPQVGILVLSPDLSVSPARIFGHHENDLCIEYVAPSDLGRADALGPLECLCATNRLRVLLLLGVISPRPRASGDAWRTLKDFFRIEWRPDRASVEAALLAVRAARAAIEERCPWIRDAVRSQSTILLESTYEVATRAVRFDVEGVLGA